MEVSWVMFFFVNVHPAIRLGFSTINQSAMGVPPWLWKPPYCLNVGETGLACDGLQCPCRSHKVSQQLNAMNRDKKGALPTVSITIISPLLPSDKQTVCYSWSWLPPSSTGLDRLDPPLQFDFTGDYCITGSIAWNWAGATGKSWASIDISSMNCWLE